MLTLSLTPSACDTVMMTPGVLPRAVLNADCVMVTDVPVIVNVLPDATMPVALR